MTPTGSLDELAARLPLLTRAQHPLAMTKSRADAFVRAVNSSGDVARALSEAGGPAALAEILAKARPADGTRALLKLVPILTEIAVLRRAYRGAAAYPLALLASVGVCAWALLTISMPAFAQLDWNRSGEPTALLVVGKTLIIVLPILGLIFAGLFIASKSGAHLASPAERMSQILSNIWQTFLMLSGSIVGLAAMQQFLGMKLTLGW